MNNQLNPSKKIIETNAIIEGKCKVVLDDNEGVRDSESELVGIDELFEVMEGL